MKAEGVVDLACGDIHDELRELRSIARAFEPSCGKIGGGSPPLIGRWPSSRLAQRAKVHSAIVRWAEKSVDGQPPITVYQAALIRDAGRFGIEFTNGDAPGVKLTATKARKGGK